MSATSKPRGSENDQAAGPPETETRRVVGRVEDSDDSVPAAAFNRYVIVEQVGRGGMGRVYRAYDPMLQREVALKQLRRHRLDDDLVAEARVMAQLSHPNVVSVYDVQVEGEALGLVMEYVPGLTLRTWIRQEEPTWEEIVDRFIDAGRGVAAAHDAGILHRDFKPANVLVGTDGATKVTDFGLAQAVEADPIVSGADSSDETRPPSGLVMGTPRYMAPEQHFGEPLTHAVDQYGFCVSLWEALCRRAPFKSPELGQKKLDGPPPWPADHVPAAVSAAIVRGLAPEPEQRWPSMNALLDALEVALRPRRRPWIAIAVGVASIGVVVAAYWHWAGTRAALCTGADRELIGTWDGSRSEAVKSAMLGIGREYAEPVWVRTQSDLDDYADAWVDMHNAACRATSLEGTQSAAMLDRRMGCLSRAKSRMEATIEVLERADADTVQKAHTLISGLPPLARCANTVALMQDVEPPLPRDADAVEAAQREFARAGAFIDAGRYDDAQAAVDQARTALEGVEYAPAEAELALRAGWVLSQRGLYDGARTTLSDALALAAKSRHWELMARTAIRLMHVVGEQQKRPEEALHYWATAQGLSVGVPSLEASARNSRAGVLYAQGRYADAEAEYRAAIELRSEELGAEHPEVVSVRNNLASALGAQGEHRLAEAEHRAVLAWRTENLGGAHPLVATSRNNLAGVLFERGAFADAEAEFRQAVVIREQALGADHPSVAVARGNLASVLCMVDRCDEGETELRLSLDIAQKSLGPDHPRVAMIRGNLATILRRLDDLDAAEVEYRAALASQEKTLAPDHPTLAQTRTTLALLLLDEERYDEALPLAEAAWSIRQQEGVSPGQRGTTAFLLARVLWHLGGEAERARARELAVRAKADHDDAGAAHEESVAEVEAWLDEHPPR